MLPKNHWNDLCQTVLFCGANQSTEHLLYTLFFNRLKTLYGKIKFHEFFDSLFWGTGSHVQVKLTPLSSICSLLSFKSMQRNFHVHVWIPIWVLNICWNTHKNYHWINKRKWPFGNKSPCFHRFLKDKKQLIDSSCLDVKAFEFAYSSHKFLWVQFYSALLRKVVVKFETEDNMKNLVKYTSF